MSTGRPISTAVSNLLTRTAKEMAKSKKSSVKLRSSECEGVMTTKWNYGSMGTISGLEFNADIVTEDGETTIRFLLRSADFEDDDVEWQSAPLEELEQRVAKEEAPHRSRLN